jgi:hypothetical protein
MNSAFKRCVVLGTALFQFRRRRTPGGFCTHGSHCSGREAFPESVTSTSDGTLIIGGLNKGVVYRAARGAATAQLWIKPDTNGLQGVLGVLADQKSDTLWVCSSKRPQGTAPTAVKTFALKTGAPIFPTPPPIGFSCLKKGGTALEVWIKDDKLAGADGLAFGDNTTLYVNTVTTGHLFRIPVGKDGMAGKIAEIKPSQPLSRPISPGEQ